MCLGLGCTLDHTYVFLSYQQRCLQEYLCLLQYILQGSSIVAWTHCVQAARPTKGEIPMGEGKASFGRAGGVCQGGVAMQVGHGCG